jgi:hypothetical protein
MTGEARMIGYELLKTGTLVSFRIVSEEVLNAPADEAEFGLRLQLKFVPLEDDEEEDEDEVAEGIVEWGAFGFMFAPGVLSFAGAKPRNMSKLEYEEKDEFKLADFIERLRFVRGELGFDITWSEDEVKYFRDEVHSLVPFTRQKLTDSTNRRGPKNSKQPRIH